MSPHRLPSLLFLAPLLTQPAVGFLPHASTTSSQQLSQHARYHASTSSSVDRRRGKTELSMSGKNSPVKTLRDLLAKPEIMVAPCAYDGMTARLIEDAGFTSTFMSGFGVSAAHGLPDTQLVSYAEMLSSASIICESLKDIPCIGDGDTGYGNSVNVKRTVKGYAQAGLAGIMIEDQVSPKRCGHTSGKSVVGREEAYNRIRAACDARDEGQDIVIIARTDARGAHGLEEALERCREFRRIGADVTFLDAPENKDEMQRFCDEVDGPKMAAMLEFGKSPILLPAELQAMGYVMVCYPITLLSAGARAMKSALARIKNEQPTEDLLEDFGELRRVVGFGEYDEVSAKYEP